MVCSNHLTIHSQPIAITNMPDLVRIAEGVDATSKPRVLKRENALITILSPVKRKQLAQAQRKAMKEALALAEAWRDLSCAKNAIT